MEDGEELKIFFNVWVLAISSIGYVYLIPRRISPGILRLISLIPVISLFLVLPLPISSVHLAIPTFLFIAWIGNFKLLLFAINRGPLASTPPLPFNVFISIALFPINPKTPNKLQDPAPVSSHKPIMLAFKALMLGVITRAYCYKSINQYHFVIQVINLCYFTLSIELCYAITALFVNLFLGFSLEIEQQFNEPFISSSVQNFWGSRWNLMVSGILRPTVYNPTFEFLTPTFGKFKSRLMSIFVTFVISGLMHELLYLYLTRVPPTWEVTWLFVIHGFCTALEVAVKKAVNGRFQLHRVVSVPLTLVFMMVTNVWLLLPQLVRNGVDVKIKNEYSDFVNLLGVEVKCNNYG